MPLTLEGAIRIIENRMKEVVIGDVSVSQSVDSYSYYGYDVYLTSLAANKLPNTDFHTPRHSQAVGILMDAAWWFVGRGILRPGVKHAGGQSTDEGASVGFSLTQLGREWLQRESPPDVPVASPSRMNVLFLDFNTRFGGAFTQRANEAVHCYEGRQYLASCVMSGAAAEGILLTLAIAKNGDELAVMNMYTGRNGRSSLERMLLGQSTAHIRASFSHYMELLKYWRDEAAHGAPTPIGEEQAYLALVGLVRFARFADEHWNGLTS